ncbi:MAG: PHP domain-containing protein, partial [Lachnospiraceae bacterium]|nr:PHP domain-containing protein [Lachnospiraceae bacterium]
MISITADTHVHSHHSGDSDADMEQEILTAIGKGLKELTFTEHLDYDYPGYPDLPAETFHLDADAYAAEFFRLKETYRDRITLRFG